MRACRLIAAAALLGSASGCASAPAAAPGRAALWGFVRLVPHAGVAPAASGATPYGDPRLRDAALVDYSRPGFAVVYLDSGASPGGAAALELRASRLGVVIEPEHAALGRGGRIAVRNATADPHVVSCPASDLVRRLAPGESLELAASEPGEQRCFLLDAADAAATVFVAPGPFVRADAAGRFELLDLEPGPAALRVWHPRFPPAERRVRLEPGAVARVDLELGVGRAAEADVARP